MPRYARAEGLPGNESLAHFILKWAAYRVLTQELECPFALLEAGAGVGRAHPRRWPRHDALGIRFHSRRAPEPWQEVPAASVRVEVLDGTSGRWREIEAGSLPQHAADPTLRAFACNAGSPDTALRAVRPGKAPGTLGIRRPGGERQELGQLCGADAKQSRNDLQAWLREAPDRMRAVQLFVLVAPVGLVGTADLPPKVGLAEVDLDQLLSADGQPAIRLARLPEPLRPARVWTPARTAEFQRHAYYTMHALFQRQLFWFLAQQAVDRRHAADGTTGQDPVTTVTGPTGGRAHRVSATSPASPASAPPRAAARVRAYVPADRAGIIALWQRTRIARPWNDPGAEIDLHQTRDRHLLLVAEAPGDGLVGAVMGGWDGRRGWVYHLAVDPAHERAGVARTLLAELEARLGAMGCRKVNLLVRGDNLGVLDFYRKVGYEGEDVRFMSKWLVPPSGAAASAEPVKHRETVLEPRLP